VAEETGLIVPIGHWVLEQAAETLAQWRGPDSTLGMAINVSAKQLLRSDLAATVADLCDQFHLKPEHVTLEVTERQLVDLVGSGLSELKSLAEYGVKIDQSFVAGMLTSATDLAIVESVIRLGTALGLDVVAEGVEDQDTADRLRELGCVHAQGWLYGHPVDSARLRAENPE
jgi:EAL domain-containing protein (putative c-di-GMP-specific phosphodiesterase class I)